MAANGQSLLLLSTVGHESNVAQNDIGQFDGTWMTKLDTAQFPTKSANYTLDKGIYECLTCVPKVVVKADGSDQKVTGHPDYDTVAARVASADSVEIVNKKYGRIVYTETDKVSWDGNMLTQKFTDTTEAQPVIVETTYTRLGKGPVGAHAISGSWQMVSNVLSNVSSNALTVTYKVTVDGLQMSTPNGESYDAKFDGKFVPINGDPGHTMVSLKRINANTIEETEQQEGKIVSVERMTVSKDSKSIQVEYTDKLSEMTTKFTMEKQ